MVMQTHVIFGFLQILDEMPNADFIINYRTFETEFPLQLDHVIYNFVSNSEKLKKFVNFTIKSFNMLLVSQSEKRRNGSNE